MVDPANNPAKIPVLIRNVKGKILGTIGKTPKGGYICNLLIGAEGKAPELLKIHSKSAADFEPDNDGFVNVKIQLQDFCFSAQ